jgi:hypothetical protein
MCIQLFTLPVVRLMLLPLFMQVCLAAETCGHVDFNTRGDVWYSSEPFHCGDVPSGHVTYWQIFQKVTLHGRPIHASSCVHAYECFLLGY